MKSKPCVHHRLSLSLYTLVLIHTNNPTQRLIISFRIGSPHIHPQHPPTLKPN